MGNMRCTHQGNVHIKVKTTSRLRIHQGVFKDPSSKTLKGVEHSFHTQACERGGHQMTDPSRYFPSEDFSLPERPKDKEQPAPKYEVRQLASGCRVFQIINRKTKGNQ